MFKGFTKQQNFRSFGTSIFGMTQFAERYGVEKCGFHLDAATQNNGFAVNDPIDYWLDSIRGVAFVQNLAASKPRFDDTDVAFNNLPVIEFQTAGRSLQSQQNTLITPDYTQVYIYQYIAQAVGSSFNSRLVGDGNHANSRTTGEYYGAGRNNNGGVVLEHGYYAGGISQQKTSAVIANALPHIVVINGSNFIADGVQIGATVQNYRGFFMTTIGGPATFSGVFKIAEVLNYYNRLNEAECIALCNTINAKYLLY
jgi:hypothetical protein